MELQTKVNYLVQYFFNNNLKVVLRVFVSAKCTGLPNCKHICEGIRLNFCFWIRTYVTVLKKIFILSLLKIYAAKRKTGRLTDLASLLPTHRNP